MADTTTWTPISAPTDFQDDAVFNIDFKTKTVQVLVEQPIVAGENLSQFIKFQAPRFYDAIDLTEMMVNILYVSPAGNKGISAAVNTEYSDDMIRCGWLVPYAACPQKGTLHFVLEFVGADYTLKTTIANTPVLDSINDEDVVPEPVEQAWYITLQADVSAALQEAQTALGRIESIFNALSTPLSADTVADMTEESAIYVYTGSETGYTYGNWYYYDGSAWVSGGEYASTALYTDAVPTQGSTNAVQSGGVYDEIAVTNERLEDVKETVRAVIGTEIISTAIYEKVNGSENLPEGFSTTLGYLRSMSASNSGNLAGTSSNANRTFWVQADTEMDVYLDPVKMGNGDKFMCIFDDAPYGSSHRATPVYDTGSTTYPFPTAENHIHVEAGQYITFSYSNGPTTLDGSAWVLYKVEQGETIIKPTVPLTDTQEEEVEVLIGKADEALFTNNGYLLLDEAKFSRHAWTSYDSTDSRNFRVRYTDPLEFDRDVFLIAEAGFFIAGFKSDGVGIGTENTCYKLSANTPVKIYIRRIEENTSETANINEFATAVKISTLLAPIEKFDYTFTDLSMFPRIGLGGDSYTNGGGIISGIRPLTWGKNLERLVGSTVDIYAKSGENIVQWATNADHGLPALLAGEECGLYWLAHGINGPTGDNLGTIADCAETIKPATFYGQYGYCIEQIQNTFPNAKIVLQTIMGTSYELYQKTYYTRNVAIKEIAEYYGIPVIDLIDDDFYKSKWYTTCMRSNHPTAMLCAGIAHANRRLFAKCVQANPNYFVDYGSN